jgi:glycosyltransferase involved in cell wall biosynthesis
MLVYNTFSSEELSLKIVDVPPDWLITTDRQCFQQADMVVFYLPGLLQEMDNDLEKSENQIWVGWFLKSDLKYQWINNPEIIDIFDVLKDYSLDEIQNGFHLARLCRKKDEKSLYENTTMNTLCLYTFNYPYGSGEQFLETEIKYLSESFDQIFIIPLQITGKKRYVPENVEVMKIHFGTPPKSKEFGNTGKWFIYCLNDIIRSKNKKNMLHLLSKLSYYAGVLYDYLDRNRITNAVHYTYWFDHHATLLSILKSKNKIQYFISRAHGYDLYNERREESYIPFRKLQLQYATKLYLVSKNGLNYITEKYPEYKAKYKLSYLGINNDIASTEGRQTPQYLVVSCSRIVDIKRVDKIVESLALIKDIPVKWVHFGDGPLFEEIKKLAGQLLSGNIEAVFYGHVDNKDIYNFYLTEKIDCFINLSSTEGLPVSIMEAISFGIPVVATNVGGSCEIVTNKVGILLQADFEIEDVKNAILEMLLTKSRNSLFRNGVYEFWKENFNAERNYPDFIDNILSDCKLFKSLESNEV